MDFPWPPPPFEPMLVVCWATLAYATYHYLPAAPAWIARLGPPGAARAVHAQRALGLLLLGIVSAILGLTLLGRAPAELGLGGRLERSVLAAALGALLVLPIVHRSARRPALWAYYPQIRGARWTAAEVCRSAMSWGLYLLGYELFFRGFLLYALARWVGPWPALALSTLAYVFVHLPKNPSEGWGSLFMGWVFGLMALWTGGIWAPLALHWAIAVLSERWVIRAQRPLSPGPGAASAPGSA